MVRDPVFKREARRDERGFTLVELLVSVSLVAAISAGMLMAMRTGLITLDQIDSRLQSDRRVMSVQQILSREISGVMPVVGDCVSSAGGVTPRIPVFNGTTQTLVLVSSYSLAEGARGYPRLLGFAVIPSDRGGVRLIVNESLYTGPSSIMPFCVDRTLNPGPATAQSFVLADRLAQCSITYQEYLPQNPITQQWLPVWNKPDLPSAVHIDMVPLSTDPASLPLESVTVPIHITRQVLSPYADLQ